MSYSVAYARPEPKFREELTRVGRGTLMGELLRRYWHPVGLVSDACDTPRLIRVLGEELILFRDRNGRPGLMYPRCAHRGASLFYGKTEDRGIRCCYHGWLFDVEGKCLEQPCTAPGVGSRGSPVRQPTYPLRERYGLIFAYMGPPQLRPHLPRYNVLERLEPGEFIEADGSSIGSGGPVIVPCNWLQHFENVMDPFHVTVLHGSFSGTQFTERINIVPEVSFEYSAHGVRSVQRRRLPSGEIQRRITEAVLPTVRAVANPQAQEDGPCSLVGWVVPLDDTSFRIYSAGRVRKHGALKSIRSRFNGKAWDELTDAEHQQFPGDFEAQVSQGAITLHSEEHLVSTDRGIVMLRRLLEGQLKRIRDKENPLGVAFGDSSDLVELVAGTVIESTTISGGENC